MTTEKMLSRVKDGVGYITFNNPEKHNAVLNDNRHITNHPL